MNQKNIHALLVIFAVLVGGILIRQQQVHRGLETEADSALDFSFDRVQTAKISVSRGGKAELTAAKTAAGWVLPELWNAKADSEKIETFLNSFSGVRGELRSNDDALLPDFGIDDAAALSLQFADAQGTILADFKVGTVRAGAASVFLRRAGSPAVFLAETDLFRLFGVYGEAVSEPLQPRLWADLEPLQFRAADLQGLESRRYDGTKPLDGLQLKKEPGENKPWAFVKSYSPFTIDSAKADHYAQSLSMIRASGVADPSGSYGFETPALELKIQTAEKTLTLTAGKESPDQKSRYLRVEGDASVYEVARFIFEDLLADDSRFFSAGLPGIDQTVVEAVTLNKQGQQQRFTPAESDAFQSLSQSLRSFEPMGFLLSEDEKKKARSPGLDSVSVEMKGSAAMVLDIGERIAGAEGQARYAAQLRGNPILFSISETDYTHLFEALKPSKPPETNASQPAPNKAE